MSHDPTPPNRPLAALITASGGRPLRDLIARHAHTARPGFNVHDALAGSGWTATERHAARMTLQRHGLCNSSGATPDPWPHSGANLERNARFHTWLRGRDDQVLTVPVQPEALHWTVTQVDTQGITLTWRTRIGGHRGLRLAQTLNDRLSRTLPGREHAFSMDFASPHPAQETPCALLRLPYGRLLIPTRVIVHEDHVAFSGHAAGLTLYNDLTRFRWTLTEAGDGQALTWNARTRLWRHGGWNTWTAVHAAPWKALTMRGPGEELLIADRFEVKTGHGQHGRPRVTLNLSGRNIGQAAQH